MHKDAERKAVRPFVTLLKPNTVSIGYALFQATNAAAVWGGVFPFLPAEFQTPAILMTFFFIQSIVYTASYFASTLGVYFLPQPTRRFLVIVASIPYFLGWCCLIGAIYVDPIAIPLVAAGGGLLGLGSAGFYMLWQRLFASQSADEGNRQLIVGMLYAALFYYALYLIPRAITSFLIPLVFLPLFGLAIVLKSREIDLDQPMFEDVPRNHPAVYRKALRDYAPSALCIGALGFCCGIVRSLAIETPAIGELVNLISMGGSFLAAAALLFAWRSKSIRINVITVYRALFPVLITAFFLMPFAGSAFSSWCAALLYAAYSAAIMLMMIQCAQASRDGGINPVYMYGFFGGVVYALHDVGFAAGAFSENLDFSGIGLTPLAVASITAVYLLGIMFFISHGGFRSALTSHRVNAESIEFVSLNAPDLSNKTAAVEDESYDFDETDQVVDAASSPNAGSLSSDEGSRPRALDAREKPPLDSLATSRESLGSDSPEGPQYRDRVSKQCALVQQNYRLSNRETEVMELLVRGNTVAHIAETLVLSENTIRTHSKRIYAKLDVHKKQELIDLVTLFNPADLAR